MQNTKNNPFGTAENDLCYSEKYNPAVSNRVHFFVMPFIALEQNMP